MWGGVSGRGAGVGSVGGWGVRVNMNEELKFFSKIQNIFFFYFFFGGGGVGVGLGRLGWM